jgi:hypothetical protein
MNNSLRWALLILLGMITYTLGLIRYDYVINVINPTRPFLLPRYIAEQMPYPINFMQLMQSMCHDPRWSSAFIYLMYPATSTCMAVFLLFKKKNYLHLTLLLYGTGVALLALLISFSSILGHEPMGFSIAQQLKKIYQEPYISLLLIGGFYWDMQRLKNEQRKM